MTDNLFYAFALIVFLQLATMIEVWGLSSRLDAEEENKTVGKRTNSEEPEENGIGPRSPLNGSCSNSEGTTTKNHEKETSRSSFQGLLALRGRLFSIFRNRTKPSTESIQQEKLA